LQVLAFLVQSVLAGNLTQYFCEKNSLEEELSAAEKAYNTSLMDSIEDEINVATRNAYLYAAGITTIGFVLAVMHAWIFYLSGTTGMRNRVLLTAVIYEKVFENIVVKFGPQNQSHF